MTAFKLSISDVNMYIFVGGQESFYIRLISYCDSNLITLNYQNNKTKMKFQQAKLTLSP